MQCNEVKWDEMEERHLAALTVQRSRKSKLGKVVRDLMQLEAFNVGIFGIKTSVP